METTSFQDISLTHSSQNNSVQFKNQNQVIIKNINISTLIEFSDSVMFYFESIGSVIIDTININSLTLKNSTLFKCLNITILRINQLTVQDTTIDNLSKFFQFQSVENISISSVIFDKIINIDTTST
jgi:hypothetical protein